MSYYCFETAKNHRLVSPYSQYGRPPYQLSRSEIVERIIAETIDDATLTKIKKHTTLPLPELITPSVNVRTVKNPRPQNSFVIYRRNVQAEIAKEKGATAAGRLDYVSKFAATKWKQESQEVKELYGFLAICAKKVHDFMYPGYVYQPKRQATTNEPMIMVHEPGINGSCKLRQQTVPTPPETPLSSPPTRLSNQYNSPPLYQPQQPLPPPPPPLSSAASIDHFQPYGSPYGSFGAFPPLHHLSTVPPSTLPPPSTLDINISSNIMSNYDRRISKEIDLAVRL
ncbi:23653_t:CDS:1 [Dentiscutata erythropus]|uniref:23653_t:CDS:1 n=1 Tax=Dentiscutata erythropus TaxID=1348616 RepID=A0A9N8Z2K9_9GLOM|nr:23653_t:CDS:1 [Dentiscutata erythropus]